jgi:hypothetical protein
LETSPKKAKPQQGQHIKKTELKLLMRLNQIIAQGMENKKRTIIKKCLTKIPVKQLRKRARAQCI